MAAPAGGGAPSIDATPSPTALRALHGGCTPKESDALVDYLMSIRDQPAFATASVPNELGLAQGVDHGTNFSTTSRIGTEKVVFAPPIAYS